MGKPKSRLMPPPDATPEAVASFHTVSRERVLERISSREPPHANTCGLDAGYGTEYGWVLASKTPRSPEEQHTVIPSTAAICKRCSMAAMVCASQYISAWPQLTDNTEMRCLRSKIAACIASIHPRLL